MDRAAVSIQSFPGASPLADARPVFAVLHLFKVKYVHICVMIIDKHAARCWDIATIAQIRTSLQIYKRQKFLETQQRDYCVPKHRRTGKLETNICENV